MFEPLESNKSIHLVKDLYRVHFFQEFDDKTMLHKHILSKTYIVDFED